MIDWSKQHCGVHQAPFDVTLELMPDLAPVLNTFPEDPQDFTWDVKVHMLMPNQYPCIPNWHYDNIPRINGMQDFSKMRKDLPMYLWISGAPYTEFEVGGFVAPRTWKRFTQADRHRGSIANNNGWRGFIRATHIDILSPKEGDHLRRHAQVYLDANNFLW